MTGIVTDRAVEYAERSSGVFDLSCVISCAIIAHGGVDHGQITEVRNSSTSNYGRVADDTAGGDRQGAVAEDTASPLGLLLRTITFSR